MLTDSYKEIVALLIVASADVQEAHKTVGEAAEVYKKAVDRMSLLRTAVESLAQLPEVQAVLKDDKGVIDASGDIT